MKNLKKSAALIMALLIIMSSCFITASAKVDNKEFEMSDAIEEAKNQENPAEDVDLKIKICADKGNWQNAPENSVSAVKNCTADYISLDVKVTSDGVPVLMADDTVDRTCVDKNGKAVIGKVKCFKAEEITELYLRSGNGGPHNQKTDEKVPLMTDAIVQTEALCILDFALGDLDAVYQTVCDNGLMSRVVFRIDGKAEDIVDELSTKDKVPETILKYDGSIIFGVNNTIKTAAESGLHMVQIGSKNQYGVIFYESVEKKIKENSLKAVFSMTDGYSAKRGDNVSGWDDVISHGYSIIETDYPELLSAYIQNCETLRSRLSVLVQKKDEYSSGKYPKNLIETYNTALGEANSVLSDTASESHLAKAFTDLNNAMNALNLAEGETTQQAALNFSTGRIIAAVLCLAAVVAAQIYFVKRRKK